MKKFIGLFIICMAMVISLSGCTLGGTPLSLVGTWETDNGSYFHIDSEDILYYGLSTNSLTKVGTITKCTCDEMTIKVLNSSTTTKYELTINKLTFTFNNIEYVCKKLDNVAIGLIK